jgi:hypothetical protein
MSHRNVRTWYLYMDMIHMREWAEQFPRKKLSHILEASRLSKKFTKLIFYCPSMNHVNRKQVMRIRTIFTWIVINKKLKANFLMKHLFFNHKVFTGTSTSYLNTEHVLVKNILNMVIIDDHGPIIFAEKLKLWLILNSAIFS